ncbi:hypothetical protein EAE91_08000 [Photorhabdus noenieputensis]|uniref:hypothetical protein n=1 Tax=Photorhabdus noenieputensis TaxID=1208607 RepID=UPI001BD69C84|nr:hypothetical protein [Photorhabdus noenieputensis]MBS9437117.1 hypothetical protein [Photorhabdus noenieputensis]MCK3670320.1 hypothetical protein [Photorhabdus noenieputensis]
MAPDLNDSYIKDLSRKPDCIKEEIVEKFYHLSKDGDLLEVIEYLLSGGEYHYYIGIIRLGCFTEDYYKSQSLEMLDSGYDEQEIIQYLIDLDMNNPDEDELIGRIAYNDFNFYDDGIKKTGKQIKGAFISPDYQAAGLGRSIYRRLVLKHNHIICDNIQSVAGGTLWASGIIALADVRVYDTMRHKFIDVLTEGGIGINGVKPWSVTHLSMSELSRWEPNSMSHDCCHHIVNIISKDKLYN